MPHPDSTRLHEETRVQGGRTFVPPCLSSARLAVAPIGVGLSKRESRTFSRVWSWHFYSPLTWVLSRGENRLARAWSRRKTHAIENITLRSDTPKNTVLWHIIRHIWGWMCMYIVAVYNLAGIWHSDPGLTTGLLLGAVPMPPAVLLGEGVAAEEEHLVFRPHVATDEAELWEK